MKLRTSLNQSTAAVVHAGLCQVRSIAVVLLLTAVAGPVALFAQSVSYIPAISNITATGAGYSGDNGPASAAKVDHPSDVTLDAGGNIYIADATNNAIRRIDAVSEVITTVAGTGSATVGYTGDNGPATAATLNDPTAVAVDSQGNIYISDTGNNVVRVVYKSGSIPNVASPVAGDIYTITGSTAGTSGSTGNGGLANAALLNFPTALAIDSANNLYIADAHNSMVRKITLSTGIISRYAGTGKGGVSAGDGGAPNLAVMNNCYGIALNAVGELYISDTKNYVIRKVNAAGTNIITVAGVLGSEGVAGQANGNGGPAMSAKLDYVQRLTVDRQGNLLMADTNAYQIRMYSPVTLNITAVAGTGTQGSSVGAALTSQLNGPLGITVDTANDIYIADAANHVVRRVNASATSPYAALNVAATGVAQSFYALLNSATTVSSYQTAAGFADFTTGTVSGCTLAASNAAGSICVAPIAFAPLAPGLRTAPLTLMSGSTQYTLGLYGTGNAPQITFTPGTVSTIAGTTTAGYTGDNSSAAAAEVNRPGSVIVDDAGTIYIADTANNAIRKIQGGVISTIAGNGAASFAGDGGAAVNAQLSGPTALALDTAGDLFLADTGNNRIREISAGVITTVAGSAISGFTGDGAAAPSAELNAPTGVVVDLAGNVYIADTGNNRVRMVAAATGFISTIAGNGTAAFAGDGSAALSAELNGPTRLAFDLSGNLYVADTLNAVVRKITLPVATISTVAGTGGSANFSGDGGVATSATLSAPVGIALDAAGNLYIADAENNRVRQVLASGGTISTIAGNASGSFAGDGGSALSASFNAPASVALDSAGKLYVADTMNSRIRLVDTSAASLNFGTVNPGSSSLPLTAVATNIGNKPLNFSGFSVAANFTQQSSGGTDCAASTMLAAGQSCNVKLIFQPSGTGSYSGAIAFTDSSLNQTAATQSVGLAGSSTLTPTGLTVTGLPANVTAGVAGNITVTAVKDAVAVASYTGTVHFTSSDPKAVLPADYTYTGTDAGTHVFAVTFKTAGAQSVSIEDTQNINIAGSEGATVQAASAASLNVLSGNNQTIQLGGAFLVGFGVQVLDAFGNGVNGIPITLTAPNTGASGTFTSGTATASATTDVNGDAVAPTFTANTTAGSYSVVATAAGLTPVSFNLTNSGNVVPAIALTLNPASATLLYGQGTVVTATLTPSVVNSSSATGSISFYDSCSAQGALAIGTGTIKAGGVATLTDAVPSIGVHSFTASYAGDSNFASSETLTAIPLTVNTASVTLTGPSTAPVVSAGQSGVISVAVAGQYPGTNVVPPTGSLSYQIGSGTASSAPIALGAATLNIPNTVAGGNYFVTVTYSGDDNYQTASVSIPLTISLQSQTITLAPNSSHTYGDAPVALNATASSGLPVSFKIVSGPGSINGSALTIQGAGTIIFEADQAGNGIYSAATAVQQSITVAKASSHTAVTPSVTSALLGANVTLTATVTSGVSGGVATGTVNFYSGPTLLGPGTLNGSGVATYATTSLAVGQDAVTAQYAGDGNFIASTSIAVNVTIAAPSFTFTLPSQTMTTSVGQNILTTMTITSTGGYSGTITFTCSNLPANASCIFHPNPVTFTPAITLDDVSFEIKTSSAVATSGMTGGTTWVALMPCLLCALVLMRRRKVGRGVSRLFAVWMLAAMFIALTGCGGSNAGSAATSNTSAGTTAFTVTATDGTVTQNTTYTLIVQ